MLVIFDNHMHLSERGYYIKAVEEFKRYGGTHLNFCPYTDVARIMREKSYNGIYDDALKLARNAEEKTGVKIFLTVGPYPIDYIKMREKLGREKAMELMKKGMEEARDFCMEGKAIAIGEIGRPHFRVEESIWEESNEIMLYGMEMAKEAGVPVVLHMERASPENMKELADMADRVGIEKEKIIKHYSPPLIYENENFGIFPSVIAKEENIREAIAKGFRFMLETDYLDDKRRPGAVLALKTIPRKIKKLLEEGVIEEEEAIIINKENPERIYGISLE